MQRPTKGDSEIVIVYYQPNLDILSNFSVVCLYSVFEIMCASRQIWRGNFDRRDWRHFRHYAFRVLSDSESFWSYRVAGPSFLEKSIGAFTFRSVSPYNPPRGDTDELRLRIDKNSETDNCFRQGRFVGKTACTFLLLTNTLSGCLDWLVRFELQYMVQ